MHDGARRTMAGNETDRPDWRKTGFNTGCHAAVRHGNGDDIHYLPRANENHDWLI